MPVMCLKAQVIAVHRLRPGDFIGYGATYRAIKRVFAAILGAGYADGIPRVLSNQGSVWLNGKRTHFLGRVSMDLSAIQCTSRTTVGSWAELLGLHIDIWDQAKHAGTIPYELFTSLSRRVKRIYD
jgi:alanine racemase